MNPVQLPHHIRSQMQRALNLPVVIDVVAKLLNQLRNKERLWRGVTAPLNLNSRWTPVSCISGKTQQGDAMKVLEVGKSKPERPFRVQEALNHLLDKLELLQPVLNFLFGSEFGVTDQLSFKRLTMPNFVRHQRVCAADWSSSSCASTISRVTRSFSIFVLPYAKLRRCA